MMNRSNPMMSTRFLVLTLCAMMLLSVSWQPACMVRADAAAEEVGSDHDVVEMDMVEEHQHPEEDQRRELGRYGKPRPSPTYKPVPHPAPGDDDDDDDDGYGKGKGKGSSGKGSSGKGSSGKKSGGYYGGKKGGGKGGAGGKKSGGYSGGKKGGGKGKGKGGSGRTAVFEEYP